MGIYRAAIDEGIVGYGGIDLLARCMQRLFGERLIAHGPRNRGSKPRLAWDGTEIQRLHNWHVTAAGRRAAKLFRERVELAVAGRLGNANEREVDKKAAVKQKRSHDVFIAHASEDKDAVARPLQTALVERGWTAWLDELELTVGDSLTRLIDQALARSRFGVVILSHAFFSKQWTERELAGLTAREVQSGTKVILPVWHEIDEEAILQYSPTLADRLGALTTQGIDHVAEQLSRALRFADARSSTSSSTERVVQAVPASDFTASTGQLPKSMSNKAAALIALARVLLDKGDVLAAETYLRQAIDAGDSHAMALLGMVAGEHGRPEESVDLLQRAVDAGRTEALAPLGLVLHELGRLDEAERALRKAATS